MNLAKRFSLFVCFFLSVFSLTIAATETPTTATPEPPKTNAEIRQWYNDQVAVIPAENEAWIAAGIPLEERARKAYEIRHHARIEARNMMQNPEEVKQLQARDQAKYGNPDGPTFEYLVEKNRAKGLDDTAVYEAIIGSANRTNKAYNKKYGARSAEEEAKAKSQATPQSQPETPKEDAAHAQ